MAPTLNELLVAAQGQPVEYDGRTVQALLLIPVKNLTTMVVTFVSATSHRPQCVRFRADHVTIDVNGLKLEEVALWTDTAPSSVVMVLQPRTSRATVKVWNEWREDGVEHAWIGNAAMEVRRESADVLTLLCSDGLGPATFDDLVVKIETKTAEAKDARLLPFRRSSDT